jgi:hypothetical protein
MQIICEGVPGRRYQWFDGALPFWDVLVQNPHLPFKKINGASV